MAYVSDHAILRYLERVEKIDIEAIRRKLSVGAIDKAAAFGCETVIMGDGTRLKLHGDVVATVLEARKHRHLHRVKH
jgi:hypothetical protein